MQHWEHRVRGPRRSRKSARSSLHPRRPRPTRRRFLGRRGSPLARRPCSNQGVRARSSTKNEHGRDRGDPSFGDKRSAPPALVCNLISGRRAGDPHRRRGRARRQRASRMPIVGTTSIARGRAGSRTGKHQRGSASGGMAVQGRLGADRHPHRGARGGSRRPGREPRYVLAARARPGGRSRYPCSFPGPPTSLSAAQALDRLRGRRPAGRLVNRPGGAAARSFQTQRQEPLAGGHRSGSRARSSLGD